MKDKRILFLLINYFNEFEVAEFVSNQLAKYLSANVYVTIVDNGSKDTSLLNKVVMKYNNVSIYTPEANAGYFGGAYQGLQYYMSANSHPDAVIICNTDITLESENFIPQLQAMSGNSDFDIMGPDVYSTFLKYHQNPYILKRISSNRIKLYKFVTSNSFFYAVFTLLHLLKSKLVKSNTQTAIHHTIDTYAIHGSFVIFNKSYFDKGGSIKYPSFLFGEELFVAETAIKLGLKTIYCPALKINHFQNTTTGTFKSGRAVRLLHQSYSYLLDSFFTDKK